MKWYKLMSSANWVYYLIKTNAQFQKELLKIHFLLVSCGNDAEGDLITIMCICLYLSLYLPNPLANSTQFWHRNKRLRKNDFLSFLWAAFLSFKMGSCGEDKNCVSVQLRERGEQESRLYIRIYMRLRPQGKLEFMLVPSKNQMWDLESLKPSLTSLGSIRDGAKILVWC